MSSEAVPSPISQLIEVFDAHLPEVEFPGVSATSLREQAEAFERTAQAVADAEVVVQDARRAHVEAKQALEQAARRGQGYAQVFASDDEALLTKLGEIELDPRGKRRKAPPKRTGARASRERKPRKATPSNVAELPLPASNGS